MKIFYILLLVLSTSFVYGQSESRLILGEKVAKEQLKIGLTDSSAFNFIDNKRLIINDTITATKIAEAILFNVYGEKNIIRQRPYEIFHLENHWVLIGTLPKNTFGGTFFIAIDDRNGKIVRLLHWK